MRRRRDFADPQPVIPIHDDDFTARDKLAVEQKIDGFLYQAIEFDYGAGAKFEHLAQQHVTRTEAQSHTKFDVEQQIKIARLTWQSVGNGFDLFRLGNNWLSGMSGSNAACRELLGRGLGHT